jgi:hypothetical protein
MKRILAPILLALTFSVMFSSPSFADWKRVISSVDGNTFYVDFERIRKVDGFVYFWDLQDYPKPNSLGYLSFKGYTQGDCKLFRSRFLSGSFHEKPMGGGMRNPYKVRAKWRYPPPDSVSETILKSVCAYAK